MEKNHNIKLTLQILEFLIENKEANIRAIAKSIKKDYKAVYYEIKKLSKDRLVSIRKIGKANLCFLIKKPHALIFLTEFKRREKFLRNKKNKDIAVVWQRLRKINKQFIILLFGSRVKGNSNKHSDIDFLVISDREVFNVISQELSLVPLKIHLTHLTYDEFVQHLKIKEKTVVSEALEKNIILFGIEDLYRLVENAG